MTRLLPWSPEDGERKKGKRESIVDECRDDASYGTSTSKSSKKKQKDRASTKQHGRRQKKELSKPHYVRSAKGRNANAKNIKLQEVGPDGSGWNRG